jgi:hypothetical protein
MFARSALVAAAGLALVGGGCMGVLAKEGKVRVRNQTAGTAFCRVEVKTDAGGPQYSQQEIAAGSDAELSFRSGKNKVCVYACEQARAYDGNDTKVIGCAEMQIGPQSPEEIVVFDGPTKPEIPTTPGYAQVVWENNLNPLFTKYKNKTWLTPYGQVRPGAFHATIEHPGVCSKTVIVQSEDRKAMHNMLSADPKDTRDFISPYPPIFLSFGLEPTRRDQRRVWDLPSGDYAFRVRDDCRGLDLVGEHYPDGATDKPKALDK